jgi:hypothetical protein
LKELFQHCLFTFQLFSKPARVGSRDLHPETGSIIGEHASESGRFLVGEGKLLSGCEPGRRLATLSPPPRNPPCSHAPFSRTRGHWQKRLTTREHQLWLHARQGQGRCQFTSRRNRVST